MPFNYLPAEIIIMAFDIHLFLHPESRRPLLFTCRAWYNIVISCSHMWEKIGWPDRDYTPFRITCHSLQSLAHAVSRTGESFDLALISPSLDYVTKEDVDEFILSAGQNWLSMCRTLNLRLGLKNVEQLEASVALLDRLMRHSDFKSLKSLSLEGEIGWHGLADVISQIGGTAPNIEQLDIDIDAGTGAPLQLISENPSFLSHISSLHLSCWYQPKHSIPWSQLTNLKHLQISQSLYDTRLYRSRESRLGLQDLAAPNLVSLHLHGDFVPSDFFSEQVIQRTTHLVLESVGDTNRGIFQCALPELIFLRIKQQGDVMDGLQAEQLQELQVDVTHDSDSSLYFLEAEVTPRVLRVNVEDVEMLDTITINKDLDFIDTLGFDEDLDIWSRLEELHLTFFEGVRHLSRVFTRALLGDKDLEPCYPALCCLTVRYSNAGKPDLSQEEKQQKVEELLFIRKRREEVGLAKITTLEVGWHWMGYSYRDIGDRSPEPWMTEWRNCLASE